MPSQIQQDVSESDRSWWALVDDLPYFAIIVLGLVGISWTSLARAPTATYWVYLTPIIGVVCIAAGWRQTQSGERIAMVVTQVLQWAAVLIAMYLITVANARQSLEANATGLMLLTLLALGVFVSGLNVRSWKLCVTAAFLALAVPMVAWVERAALLLVLVGVALIGLLILYWWLRERSRREA
jgi:Flp pilus assembly protein TadB